MPEVSTVLAYVHHDMACVIHACFQSFARGSRRRLRGWAQAPRLPEGARYNARCARAPGAEQRPDSIFDYQFKLLKAYTVRRFESGLLHTTSPKKRFESCRKRIRKLRLGPESGQMALSF